MAFQQAPGGQYVLQPQTLSQGQQTTGPAGPPAVKIAPATSEVHYGVNGTFLASQAAVQIDGTTSTTLANRVSIEIYNNGAANVEVDTDKNFTLAGKTGRVIAPGTSWSVLAGPANIPGGISHYVLGAAGAYDLRITEAGQ